jgi:phosphopantothenoylcysteine decarboxylase/phosphopantothenate--cysteine ligase
MGYSIATRARKRGAEVTLITGPVTIAPPRNVEVIKVTTALEMHAEVTERAPSFDVLIMAAAVGDYRVAEPSSRKLKRSAAALSLRLMPNPDILAAVGLSRPKGAKPFIVGFALETEELIASARSKLTRKGCDLVVANLASQSIGRDDSTAQILDKSGVIDRPGELSKDALADRILNLVLQRIS